MLCSIDLILIYSSMWLWFTFILYIKYATVINSIYRHISLNRTSCVWLSALLAASSCGSVAIQPEVKTNRRSTTFQWSNTAEAVFQFSACHLAMFPPTNCQGTSSARVATITRAMLTIMENEILNFLKRRSRRSKNKVKPGNPENKWKKYGYEWKIMLGKVLSWRMTRWFATFKWTKWTCRSANYS